MDRQTEARIRRLTPPGKSPTERQTEARIRKLTPPGRSLMERADKLAAWSLIYKDPVARAACERAATNKLRAAGIVDETYRAHMVPSEPWTFTGREAQRP